MPLAPNTAPPCPLRNRVHNPVKVMKLPICSRILREWSATGTRCSQKWILTGQDRLEHVIRNLKICPITGPEIRRVFLTINLLTPNDPYMGRTAPLTSKLCILYIYSTNIATEYFKHALYSPFFFLFKMQFFFIMLTCLVPVLFTFYIKNVLKLKKKIIPARKV